MLLKFQKFEEDLENFKIVRFQKLLTAKVREYNTRTPVHNNQYKYV